MPRVPPASAVSVDEVRDLGVAVAHGIRFIHRARNGGSARRTAYCSECRGTRDHVHDHLAAHGLPLSREATLST